MDVKNRILITGAQGFVGRYLLSDWLSFDPTVDIQGIGRSPESPGAFTHLTHWAGGTFAAPVPDALRIRDRNRFRYVALDVLRKTDLTDLLREFRPRVIVHLASLLPGADTCQLFQDNICGTVTLLEAIADSSIKVEKLVISSSSAVYGAPSKKDLPLSESLTCVPIDQYGASKLAAEHASRIIADREAIPTVWARSFNVVGPGQHETHLFGMLARSVASIQSGISAPTLTVGSLDATRDYTDVRDVACGLRLLADRGLNQTIYNLASGKEVSARSLVKMFLNLARLDHVQVEEDREAPRIRRHFAAIDRIKALGFRPSRTLPQSVADALNYYQRQVIYACAAQARAVS